MRDSPFFKDTPKKILEMDGEAVEFPVLYYDFRSITCFFTAKTSQVKKLLPHPNFKPIEIWPRTSMLIISAFEYLDTSIGPYNEIAIAVPVAFPPRFMIPGLATISMLRKNAPHIYIHQLPVTTEIALKGGVHFYNYPKFLAQITFQDQGENLVVSLKENDNLILNMFTKKLATKRSDHFQVHTYSIRENVVMHTLVEQWAPSYGRAVMGDIARLELGKHRISEELAGLNISMASHIGLYAEGMMAKLYDPDKHWNIETLAQINLP